MSVNSYAFNKSGSTYYIIYINVNSQLVISKPLIDLINRGVYTIYSLHNYTIDDMNGMSFIKEVLNYGYIYFILLACGELIIIANSKQHINIFDAFLPFIMGAKKIKHLYENCNSQMIIAFLTFDGKLYASFPNSALYSNGYYSIKLLEYHTSIINVVFFEDLNLDECNCMLILENDTNIVCTVTNEGLLLNISLSSFVENKKDIICNVTFDEVLISYSKTDQIFSSHPYSIFTYSDNYSLLIINNNGIHILFCIHRYVNLKKLHSSQLISNKTYNKLTQELSNSQELSNAQHDTNYLTLLQDILGLADTGLNDTYKVLYEGETNKCYILNNEILTTENGYTYKIFEDKHYPTVIRSEVHESYI